MLYITEIREGDTEYGSCSFTYVVGEGASLRGDLQEGGEEPEGIKERK